MMYCIFFIVSGLIGLWAHYYMSHFSTQLIQDVYESYCEIFPKNPPHFEPPKSKLKPIKSGQNWQYFLGANLLFCINTVLVDDLLLGLSFTALLIILIVISVIDWYYKLISPALCQFLLCGGLCSAYFNYFSLTLEKSLFSAMVSFLIFWSIFHLSKWCYHAEVFGRGDYWLIAALSSFLPWQSLPLFIFLSCLLAIIYALIAKTQTIPFAPFLSIGAISTFMLG